MSTTNSGQQPDRIFDHEFDGIREYDNPLPTWWVWIYVLTVLFAFPYVLHYHFGHGPSVYDNLNAEREAYAAMLVAAYGELEPNEATLLQYMDDDVAMTGMAGVFRGKCAQCHLADGSGSVGPNLTDDVWINVKSIDDIPKILNSGLPDRGMPAWGGRLTETQIVLLSSYVAQLSRNPVAGKAPQGDPIPPWPEPAAE